jgi:hypothetical protein
VVSITPTHSLQTPAIGSDKPNALVLVPENTILNFQPKEFGHLDGVGGFNYILGTATINGSEKVSVIAKADNANKGQYILVPPNSNLEDTLRLLRNPNSKVA